MDRNFEEGVITDRYTLAFPAFITTGVEWQALVSDRMASQEDVCSDVCNEGVLVLVSMLNKSGSANMGSYDSG